MGQTRGCIAFANRRHRIPASVNVDFFFWSQTQAKKISCLARLMKRSLMHHWYRYHARDVERRPASHARRGCFPAKADGLTVIVSELNLLRKTSPSCIMAFCDRPAGETNGCSLHAASGNNVAHPEFVPSVAIPTILLQRTFTILYVSAEQTTLLLYSSRSDRYSSTASKPSALPVP